MDDKRQELTNALGELIAIPSLKADPLPGAPFGEDVARALAFMLDEARRLGMAARNEDNYYGVVTVPSANPDAETLGVLVHLDVVPTGDPGKWIDPPFSAKIVDGKMYGRGTSDDKGPAIAALYALAAVVKQGVPFKRNVQLILGCDEESGWGDIAHFEKTEKLPDIAFSPDSVFPVVNAEKGILHARVEAEFAAGTGARVAIFDGGTATNCVPNYACALIEGVALSVVSALADSMSGTLGVKIDCTKSGENVKIEVYGGASHGSRPDLGINSVTALLELIQKLPLAPCRGHELLASVSKAFGHGVHDGSGCGIECYSKDLHSLTASLNVLHYDGKSLKALIDIRHPEVITAEAILKKMADAIGCAVVADSIKHHHLVSPDSELVQTLMKIYCEYTGAEANCIVTGGGTYARAIDNAVSFGGAFPGDDDCAHMPNEYIDLDKLMASAKIYAQAIAQLAT